MKYTVHLTALAGLSVDLELEEKLSFDEICELAMEKADISDADPSTWTEDCEIELEDGSFLEDKENAKHKTLVLFTDLETNKFIELVGDFSHLDNVLIGSEGNDLELELESLLYNKGELKSDLKILEKPSKDWDSFIEVGTV